MHPRGFARIGPTKGRKGFTRDKVGGDVEKRDRVRCIATVESLGSWAGFGREYSWPTKEAHCATNEKTRPFLPSQR